MTKSELTMALILWAIGTYHYAFMGEHVVGALWFIIVLLYLIVLRLGDIK